MNTTPCRPSTSVWLIFLARTGVRSKLGLESFASQSWPLIQVEGVDGSTLENPHPSEAPLVTCQMMGRKLSAGEVGCFFSHQKVLRAFLESTDEWAFVVEDDAVLVTGAEIIHEHVGMLPDSPALLFPFSRFDPTPLGTPDFPKQIGVEEYSGMGPQNTAGYIVNRAGAAHLLGQVLAWPMLPVDEAIRRSPIRKFKTVGDHIRIDRAAGSLIEEGRNVARRAGRTGR